MGARRGCMARASAWPRSSNCSATGGCRPRSATCTSPMRPSRAPTSRRPSGPPPGSRSRNMQWNLRLAAAQRGIWRSSDLRQLLAEAGSGDLGREDVAPVVRVGRSRSAPTTWTSSAAVLGCEPGDLLIRDPAVVKGSQRGGARLRWLEGLAVDPAVAPRWPVAAAGMTAATWPVVTCTACGTTGPGPPQGRIVQTLLCPRPAVDPIRPCAKLRARTRPHLAAGLCARCYRLSRTRLVICSGLRRASARSTSPTGASGANAGPLPVPGPAGTAASRSRGCGRAAARSCWRPDPAKSPAPAATAGT